jgi:ubiquinone/menaquinone biosynthesis C-methylase UbiE
MQEIYVRLYKPSGQPGPDYWFYFADRLTQLASIQDEAVILDIGTFDGNVLFKAMNKVPDLDYAVGIDIDKDGFNAGISEANNSGRREKVGFVQMDSNALGFQPETFDNALANFLGFDDFYDFEQLEFKNSSKMMKEMIRILKPGGQVGIGSWVEQSDIDWIVEEFLNYFPDISASYGTGFSCYSKENPEGQKAILKNCGFEDIRVYVEKADFVSPELDTWWHQMERASGEYFLGVPDPEKLDGFKEQVFADLEQFRCRQGIRFSKSVSFAFGTKPR